MSGYGGGYGGQRGGNGGGYGNGGNGQRQEQAAPPKKEYPIPQTFDEAKNYKLNFGKHKGGTLNEVARSDEGLSYLVWLGDNIDGDKFADTYAAIGLFLGDARVARDVADLQEKRAAGGRG